MSYISFLPRGEGSKGAFIFGRFRLSKIAYPLTFRAEKCTAQLCAHPCLYFWTQQVIMQSALERAAGSRHFCALQYAVKEC